MFRLLIVLLLFTGIALYFFGKFNKHVVVECFKSKERSTEEDDRPAFQDVLYGYKVAFDSNGSSFNPMFQTPHTNTNTYTITNAYTADTNTYTSNTNTYVTTAAPASTVLTRDGSAAAAAPATTTAPPTTTQKPQPRPVEYPTDPVTYTSTVTSEAQDKVAGDKKTLETQHFVVVYDPSMWSQDNSELRLVNMSSITDWEKWFVVFIEDVWNVFVYTLGLPPPHNSNSDPNKKNIKLTIAVMNGLHVNLGYVALSVEKMYYTVIQRPSVLNEWIVAHEFGHIFMGNACVCSCSWQGLCSGEEETGALRESIANWFAIEYLAIKKDIDPTREVPFIHDSRQVFDRTQNRQVFFGSEITVYADFFFFYYLQRDPDGHGFDKNIVSKILTGHDDAAAERRLETIMRVVNETNPGMTMAQLFGYYYRRYALFDFPYVQQTYLDKMHEWCKGNTVNRKRLNSMTVSGNTVVSDDSTEPHPQNGGYNVVTIEPTPGSKEIQLTITQTGSDWQVAASLFRYNPTSRAIVYSDLVGSGDVCKIAVDSTASWYGFTVTGAWSDSKKWPFHTSNQATNNPAKVEGSVATMPYTITLQGAAAKTFDV